MMYEHWRLYYAISSFFAAVHGLCLLMLMICSVGDKEQVFNVQVWFSWEIALVIVLLADHNVHNIYLTSVGLLWRTLVRLVGGALATAQAVGFLIWIAIEWDRQNDSLPNGAPAFYPTAVATLACLAGTGLCMTLPYLMQLARMWWEERHRRHLEPGSVEEMVERLQKRRLLEEQEGEDSGGRLVQNQKINL